MKVLLSSFGSSGDFNPFYALGRALLQAGHEVNFLANPYYEDVISNIGMNFIPAGEYIDVYDLLKREPKFLDKNKGPKALIDELVIPGVKDMFPAALEAIKREKIDLVVCHLLELGGSFAALQSSIPYCILTSTPSAWLSVHQPSYYGHSNLPLWAHKHLIRLVRPLFYKILQLKFTSVCKELSVPKQYASWEFLFSNALLNLGPWSEYYRPAAPDDPPNSHICGFFRDEHVRDWKDVPAEVEEFFSSGSKPIVVGMGSTAAIHGHRIYDNIIPACKNLNQSLFIVGPELQQYNDPANNILTTPFAPFGWVFPKASSIVHHGGINTTAEALRAGVPSMIVPFGYDQFDNALRIERMNAGKRLILEKLSPSIFTKVISDITSNQQMCRDILEISASLSSQRDGAEVAVELITQKF